MEIKKEILFLLKDNPEELKHAQDTLKWLLVIKPDANEELKISALGHDIERGITPWINLKDIHTKEFREKHAERSSEIIKKLLEKYEFNKEKIEEISSLILKHEWGGNEEQNLIRDADSLANFQWCDDFFGTRELEELKQVARGMYNRMSPENRKFITTIDFKNKEIEEIVKKLN